MKATRRKRLRDLVLEVAIGLGIVAAILVYAAYHEGPPSVGWVGLPPYTAIVFGYPLRWCRRYWRRAAFWIACCALLVLHLAAFITALRVMAHFGTLWFAILLPVEWTLIFAVLEHAGRYGHHESIQ